MKTLLALKQTHKTRLSFIVDIWIISYLFFSTFCGLTLIFKMHLRQETYSSSLIWDVIKTLHFHVKEFIRINSFSETKQNSNVGSNRILVTIFFTFKGHAQNMQAFSWSLGRNVLKNLHRILVQNKLWCNLTQLFHV